jgi:AraC-like DNA-binding protein
VADVGYASESALSRAFKAQVGVTPREWRGRTARKAAA